MMVEGDLDALELEGRVTVACEFDPAVPVGLFNVEPIVPSVVAPGAPSSVEFDEELV
jgi:hypothetical protein